MRAVASGRVASSKPVGQFVISERNATCVKNSDVKTFTIKADDYCEIRMVIHTTAWNNYPDAVVSLLERGACLATLHPEYVPQLTDKVELRAYGTFYDLDCGLEDGQHMATYRFYTGKVGDPFRTLPDLNGVYRISSPEVEGVARQICAALKTMYDQVHTLGSYT